MQALLWAGRLPRAVRRHLDAGACSCVSHAATPPTPPVWSVLCMNARHPPPSPRRTVAPTLNMLHMLLCLCMQLASDQLVAGCHSLHSYPTPCSFPSLHSHPALLPTHMHAYPQIWTSPLLPPFARVNKAHRALVRSLCVQAMLVAWQFTVSCSSRLLQSLQALLALHSLSSCFLQSMKDRMTVKQVRIPPCAVVGGMLEAHLWDT